MTTATETKTERDFINRMVKLEERGIILQREDRPESQFFGSRVCFSAYNRGTFLSWTLTRKGGLNKKTTVRKFATINGKKADFYTAMMRFECSI
jgi:hypothetical protein